MGRKAGNGQRSRCKLDRKLRMQRLGDGWFDLVLDSDVQTRTGLVLRDEQSAKIVRQFVADRQ